MYHPNPYNKSEYQAELQRQAAPGFQPMPQVLERVDTPVRFAQEAWLPNPYNKSTGSGFGFPQMAPKGNLPAVLKRSALGSPLGRVAGLADKAGQMLKKRTDWSAEVGPNTAGWTQVCGSPPVGNLICGPNFVPGVSCSLGGQAGRCADLAEIGFSELNMSVIFHNEPAPENPDQHVRYYAWWYHRDATGNPEPFPAIRRPMTAILPTDAVHNSPKYKDRNGADPPRLDPPVLEGYLEPPVEKPPGPGNKEQKLKWNAIYQGFHRFLANPLTETLDVVECLHGALPKGIKKVPVGKVLPGDRDKLGGTQLPKRKNPKTGKWEKNPLYDFPGARRVHQTPQTMLPILYRHWDKIDWVKAVDCIAKNHIIDRAVGGSASKSREILTKFLKEHGMSSPASGFRGFWGPGL